VKFIYVNIEGWLTGTIFQSMSKGEAAIWHEFNLLGGDGKGRYGYIEKVKGLGYTRQELLNKCNCFSNEDIALFDSCMKKCLEGIQLGSYFDEPRILAHPNGIYEIINWTKYQHPDYIKGCTEDEARELRRKKREATKSTEGLQVDNELNSAQAASDLAKKALQVNPHVARRVVTDYDKKMYGQADGAPKLDEDTGELQKDE
jgi:hypothetical protein